MNGLITSGDKSAAGLLDSHLIAATRLILAVSAVLILDYTSMARFNSDATRLVLVLYIAYSAALYLLTARRIRHKQAIPIWSQWTDIVWYTLLLALSGGSNSIFFFGFFFAQGGEPQLGVVGLTAPLLPILRTIIRQQEDTGTSHTLTQGIEKPLRLTVDPVQVFKEQDQGLIETLAQKELLDSIKRPSAPNLRVHLL